MVLQRRRLHLHVHLCAVGALIALAAPGPLASVAAAQDALSVEVSPLRAELKMTPGAAVTQAVTVRNEGKQAVHVIARVDDWYLSKDGTPQFKPADPEDPFSAASWLKLNPTDQMVEPGATAVVRFTVTVPLKTTDGGYRAAVMFEFEPPSAASGAAGRDVRFRSRVATVVYATVGTPAIEVEMTDLQISAPKGRPQEVVATLKNTGRTHVRTNGTVTIYGPDNAIVRKLVVPNVPVLPGSERDVQVATSDADNPPLPPGRYRVEIRIDVGLPSLLVGETTLEIPPR